MPTSVPPRAAKTLLLDAALDVIRAKGYAATTVDELCAAAGVTKGGFFHHFASKEALGVAAADHWTQQTGALFAATPYHAPADPRDRVLAYVDFRSAILQGAVAEYTCLAGTLVQEVHDSSPAIRDACARSITGHAATLVADIAATLKGGSGAAKRLDAHKLALHTQAVLQGAFILAKATQDTATAAASIAHLRRYLELLFERPQRIRPTQPAARKTKAAR